MAPKNKIDHEMKVKFRQIYLKGMYEETQNKKTQDLNDQIA